MTSTSTDAIRDRLHASLRDRFGTRWTVDTSGTDLRMNPRRRVGPASPRRTASPHAIADGLRGALRQAGLLTDGAVLPVLWDRDTQLIASAVQALDPWLKSRLPYSWSEGFLPQPAVRFTGERDAEGRLLDGFLTSFVNVSYVQRITSPHEHAALMDHWIGALSHIGIHAGRLSVTGALEVWHRPPVAGITLFLSCDGEVIGDAVLLWHADTPAFMATDLGSGVENLRWRLGGQSWPRAAFGELAEWYDPGILDASRTATLLLMSGIRPAARGAGHSLRLLARAIPPGLAASGLGRLVRHHHDYWTGFGVTGAPWPHLATCLEEEVLRTP
ncbi:hypothetical protein R6L23_10680 [Streptomyces sp. SR27]|uniref:hypothetical protein n=1 Tax=Streptomyces sp. SR27 TaxID=3076630 RepID=UPI00295A5CFE|nr:hypothetical protein [Streptomyces sp. SR27]MDV9188675.1 hypothetical protein [Streptomyces sp. SR27]